MEDKMAENKLIGDLTVLVDIPEVIQANLGIEEAVKLCEDAPPQIGLTVLYKLTEALLTTEGRLDDNQREVFFEHYSKKLGEAYERLFVGETKIEKLTEQKIFSNPFVMLQKQGRLFEGDIDEFIRTAIFIGSFTEGRSLDFNKKYGGEVAGGVNYQAKFDEKRGLYVGRWNSKVAPEGIRTNGIFSLKEL